MGLLVKAMVRRDGKPVMSMFNRNTGKIIPGKRDINTKISILLYMGRKGNDEKNEDYLHIRTGNG